MFGDILSLLILLNGEFYRVAYFEIIEVSFDILAVEKEVVVGILDESKTIFQTQNFTDLCGTRV